MRAAILGAGLLLDGCVTCTQQAQQRELQAGQLDDVTEGGDSEDSKEERETDLALKVPLKLP